MKNLYTSLISSSLYYDFQDAPINWKPFSPDAFDKTGKLNLVFGSDRFNPWMKLIKESTFKDEQIVSFMNEHFNCLVLDKKRNPHYFYYYQLAQEVIAKHSMTPFMAFTLEDGAPYFINSVFQKESTEQAPAFIDILKEMLETYRDSHEQAVENAKKVHSIVNERPQSTQKIEFQGHFPSPDAVLNALSKYQDQDNGGYVDKTKQLNLSFYEYATEQILEGMVSNEQAEHIIKGLELMLMSGVFDQVKGGIHRFSYTSDWQGINFEKALSDQAALLKVLAKMTQIYPAPLFFDAMIQTMDYLSTQMRSDEGYFIDGQDFESEGVDGLYYKFSQEELDNIIVSDEKLINHQDTLLKWFSMDKVKDTSTLYPIKMNHQYKEEFYTPENWELVRHFRQQLLEERKERIPPRSNTLGVARHNFELLSSLIDVVQYCSIDSIKEMATQMLNENFEKIHQVFIEPKDRPFIHHTTERDQKMEMFEDYTAFAHVQLRFYELSGIEVFKENGHGILLQIQEQFFSSDFPKAFNSDHLAQLYPRLVDIDTHSSFATYLALHRKWQKVLNLPLLPKYKESLESIIQLVLQNPLRFGEFLRFLTYPDLAYKIINVPRSWLEDKSFHPFQANFSSRFVLTYNEQSNWSLANFEKIELEGESFQQFQDALKA